MRWQVWCGGALLAQALAAHAQAMPAPAPALLIDTAHSRIGFEVRTRFGQRLEGDFPVYDGLVETLPDGRHLVRLRISTAAAQIPDKPRYTAWMRGENFFDTVRYPWMEFVSDPYTPGDLSEGGALSGRLTLRGTTRSESLALAPSTCARPGLDCAVAVSGDIDRSRYGMDEWQFAVGDRVRLRMQVRLRDNPAP